MSPSNNFQTIFDTKMGLRYRKLQEFLLWDPRVGGIPTFFECAAVRSTLADDFPIRHCYFECGARAEKCQLRKTSFPTIITSV